MTCSSSPKSLLRDMNDLRENQAAPLDVCGAEMVIHDTKHGIVLLWLRSSCRRNPWRD
jgi:hypothetical protein